MAHNSTNLPPVDDGYGRDDTVAEEYARVMTAIIDDLRDLCMNLTTRLRLAEAMLEGIDGYWLKTDLSGCRIDDKQASD